MTADSYQLGLALQHCELALSNIDQTDERLVALYEIAIQELREQLEGAKFYEC